MVICQPFGDFDVRGLGELLISRCFCCRGYFGRVVEEMGLNGLRFELLRV